MSNDGDALPPQPMGDAVEEDVLSEDALQFLSPPPEAPDASASQPSPPPGKWTPEREVRYYGVPQNDDVSASTRFCLPSLVPPGVDGLAGNKDVRIGEKARCSLARALIEDVLALPVRTDDDSSMVRVRDMLVRAVQANDAEATSALWMKLDEHMDAQRAGYEPNDAGRFDLGMGETAFTHAQLHFLIFHVRQPKLVLCMMADRSRRTKAHEGWMPHIGGPNPTWEATAMVAAVMDTVAGVKARLRDDLTVCFSEDTRAHEANMQRLPRDAERWWRELLSELYRMLPFCPKPVRTCVGEVVGHRNPPQGEISLLKLAVNCSELSCEPLKGVLKRCTFEPSVIKEAFLYAIHPGAVRGETAIDVAKLLIEDIAMRRVIDTEHVRDAKRAMWVAVVNEATHLKTYALTTTRKGTMRIHRPRHNHELHPSQFVAILNLLVSYEREVESIVKAERVQPMLLHALTHMIGKEHINRYQSYMVEELLLLWHSKSKSTAYLDIHEFLPRLLEHYTAAFDVIEPHLSDRRLNGTFVAKPEHADKLGAALYTLLMGRHRDSVRRLMRLFDAAPPVVARWETLQLFILNLVKRVTSSLWLGESVQRVHNEEMKRDFRCFLELGNFSEEVLERALEQACKRESPIAVEVLVSPPYNVRHSHDNGFAHMVVSEMLKPDEPTVAKVAESFAKRQKLAHGDEDAEEAK